MSRNKSLPRPVKTLSLEELIEQQSGYVHAALRSADKLHLCPWEPWDAPFKISNEQTEHTTTVMLNLLLTWTSWMKRRVEHIQINSQSQTRRKITFDFQLPLGSELPYPLNSAHEDYHQVCIPLTFLRKGMLVNLDLESSEGQSLPSLSFSENTWLTFAPMLKMIQALDLEKVAERLWPNSDLTWDLVFRRALLDVIQSRNQHEGSLDDAYRKREQELHRRSIFGSIAEYCFWLKEEDSPLWFASRVSGNGNAKEHNDDPFWGKVLFKLMEVPVSTAGGDEDSDLPAAGSILGWIHTPEEKNTNLASVIDSAFSVQTLAVCLLQKIRELSTHGDNNSPELAVVERLATMLSVTSISYLFATVLPREEVFPDSRPLRQLVKFGCDVEIDSFDENSARKKLIYSPTPKISDKNPAFALVLALLWPKFAFEQRLLLRYSQWSASSTHLEVSTPSDIRVKSITSTVSSAYTSSTEMFDPSDVSKFKLSQKAIDLPKREELGRLSAAENKREQITNYQPRKFRGSYKQALGKVHINFLPFGTHPVQLLFMNLVPDGLVGVAGAIFTSLLAMVLAVTNVLCPLGNGLSSVEIEVADQIALFTLFVGIFGALFYSTNKNLIARGLHRTSTRLFVVSFIVTMLATTHLCLGHWILEQNSSRLSWFWTYSIWLLLLPIIHFLRALITMYKVAPLLSIFKNGNNHQENQDFYEEIFIKEDKTFPLLPDSREAIAVTETDLFDTRPYFMGKSKNADMRVMIHAHKETVTRQARNYLQPNNQ